MSVFKIPTRNDLPAFSESIELDGVIFETSYRFNERAKIWIMDLNDSAGNPIFVGLPVLTNVPLFAQYVQTAKPLGDIIPLHRDELKDDNAGESDLGDLVNLFYADSEEIA
jgi:hypothetical protein